MAKKNRRRNGGGSQKGGGSLKGGGGPPDQKVTEGGADGDTKAPESVAKEWSKSLGVAVVLFLVIRTFILQTFVITSGSMEEALLVGDFLIANRAAVGVRIPWTQARIPGYSSVRPGDVLVFDPPHEPDLKLVKRLIAVSGDTVSMKDGALTINGRLGRRAPRRDR